jgi:WhiB family redox-sensing transcriptional regulator
MTRVLVERPAWFEFAACKGMDTTMFYPDTKPTIEAREVCQACPAQLACLDFALEHDEDDGLWGGVGLDARRRIKRQRRTESVGDVRKCRVCSTPFVTVTLRHFYCCRPCQVRGRNSKNWVKV